MVQARIKLVNRMERSLVIIKPDGAVRRTVGARVIEALHGLGLRVRAFREMRVSQELAEKHYAVHKGKPFFPWLVQFITSGRVLVLVFEGENAIQRIRDALGPTFVQKAPPDTLRGRYGIWGGINIAHASDSPETAATEIDLWSREGNVRESDGAEKEMLTYIERYTAEASDHTSEIREVVVHAIDSDDVSSSVLESLEVLIAKDARDVEDDEVEKLAEAIFALVKEEVSKSG